MLAPKSSFEEFGNRITQIAESIENILKLTSQVQSPELSQIWEYVAWLSHAERMHSEDMKLLQKIEHARKLIEWQLKDIENIGYGIKHTALKKNFLVQRSYLNMGKAAIELRYLHIQFLVMNIRQQIQRRISPAPKNSR